MRWPTQNAQPIAAVGPLPAGAAGAIPTLDVVKDGAHILPVLNQTGAVLVFDPAIRQVRQAHAAVIPELAAYVSNHASAVFK
jgi:hypothetical protein